MNVVFFCVVIKMFYHVVILYPYFQIILITCGAKVLDWVDRCSLMYTIWAKVFLE